jgi:hypothetical protein
MRYIIIILVVLCSCNPQLYHSKKAEKHLNWLRDHGATFKSDTVFKQLGVKVHELNLKFETRIVSPGEKVLIFKEPAGEVKLTFDKDEKGNQTVTPEVKILERIKYIKVPYKVTTTVECKQDYRWYNVWISRLIALIIGILMGIFWRPIRKFLTIILG